MGRQHLRDGFIHLRQKKTGTPLGIAIHPVLAEILDLTSSGHLTFLTTQHGAGFSSSGSFAQWFRKQCDRAALPGDAPDFVEVGEEDVAVSDAMLHRRCVQFVG
jgi:hypothetical protein